MGWPDQRDRPANRDRALSGLAYRRVDARPHRSLPRRGGPGARVAEAPRRGPRRGGPSAARPSLRRRSRVVSLTTNSPHRSAPSRRLAAFSSSPLALLAASFSALRCIHLATNLCSEFLARHTNALTQAGLGEVPAAEYFDRWRPSAPNLRRPAPAGSPDGGKGRPTSRPGRQS